MAQSLITAQREHDVNDIVLMSMRCDDLASTSIRCHFGTKNKWNQNEGYFYIIFFLLSEASNFILSTECLKWYFHSCEATSGNTT